MKAFACYCWWELTNEVSSGVPICRDCLLSRIWTRQQLANVFTLHFTAFSTSHISNSFTQNSSQKNIPTVTVHHYSTLGTAVHNSIRKFKSYTVSASTPNTAITRFCKLHVLCKKYLHHLINTYKLITNTVDQINRNLSDWCRFAVDSTACST